MSSPKRSLDEWVQALSRAELPVLGRTVTQLASVNDYLSSHAAELVRVILHDPNMTAKVLRLANSVLYNQARKPINTVSRAIVVLGYEAIRSICLATFVLEKAASGTMQEQLQREVARSFHAAVQAKSMAELRGDTDSEEIFIAALLFHLGEMAFWCFGDASAKAMSEALAGGMAPTEAQSEIMGFRFTALTLALTREWGISPVLQEALQSRDTPESRSRGIRLSHQLVQAIEQGWDSIPTQDSIRTVSQYLKLETRQARQAVYNNALLALDTLSELGMTQAGRLVPMPPGLTDEAAAPPPRPVLAPNPALQLSILRELTTMVGGSADINLILQHVLEGLHRGVGFERAVFALVNPQRTLLTGKYAVQEVSSDLVQAFRFALDGHQAPLAPVVQSREMIWGARHTSSPLSAAVRAALGADDFLLAPLWVNNRLIGAFYADCAVSRRAITQDDADAFQLFVAQAGLCLQMLTSRKAGS